MSDPWGSILTSLEPDYGRLKEMLEKGLPVSAKLSKKQNKWAVTIAEETMFSYRVIEFVNNLDEKIQWAVTQLNEWPNVNRMSYDTWFFRYKRDAEKFQTLFALKWAE